MYYVLTLKLKTEKWHEDKLNKRFKIGSNIYNACIKELYRKYNLLIHTQEFETIVKMQKGKERNKQFSELYRKYGLTEYSLHKFVVPMRNHFKENIDSNTIQKIASRAFVSFQKYMYHKCKKVYLTNEYKFHSLEGKTNAAGIKFKKDRIVWLGLNIPIIINAKDKYAQESILKEIKYCRVIRKWINNKYKYYVQLIISGNPPLKINSTTGEIKNLTTKGKVGIDIGVQTVAIVGENDVKLFKLAPEVNKIDMKISILMRKLERQRRANNPNKYNENGSYKKRNDDGWIYSKRYIKTRNKIKDLYRKMSIIRRQSHNRLVNYIIELGNEFYVENMDFDKLRSKKKNKDKRSFSRSINNKAPAMFLTILNNKLKFQDNFLIRVNTFELKASQYNHITNEYKKKQLNERWNNFQYKNKEIKVHRDLYSAFLIQHVNDDLKTINVDLCDKDFERFLYYHNEEVEKYFYNMK